MLSRDSSFDNGLEFEETFPEPAAAEPEPVAEQPAPAAPPRLSVVRSEPEPEPAVAPGPTSAPGVMVDLDAVVERIDSVLNEWQATVERRMDDRFAAFRAEIERREAARELTPAVPAAPKKHELPDPVRDAIRAAVSVRDVARVVRDAVSELTETAAFSMSVHHATNDEVVYRYRVAADEELGALLRRDALDDAPDGAAAHADGWVRAQRTIRMGARNVTVHTTQCAIRFSNATIGVLTLQSQGAGISDPVLARVTNIVTMAAPRIAELRAANALRGA